MQENRCSCADSSNCQGKDPFKTYSNLYLMMTHDCNFACEYCFNHADKNSVLSFDIAKKAIDIYVDHSSGDSLGIVFFGGEPLLQLKEIVEIKRYCEETYPTKTWSYSITTNLSFINDLVDKEILLDPKVSALVSLDGPEYVNVPRVWKGSKKETFQTVYQNLTKVFSDTKYKEKIDKNLISVRATLSKTNVNYLYDIVVFLYENFGINWVLNNVDEDDWSDVSYEEFEAQFLKIVEYAERLDLQNRGNKKLTGKRGSELLSCIKFFKDIGQSFRSHFLNIPNQQEKSCGQCFGQLAVDYTGKFSPCHRFTNIALQGCSDYVVGDVNSGLNYDSIKRIRELDSLKENQCVEKQCKKLGTCAFGCFAAGVEINNFKPRCNGDPLKNLFDMSYSFISKLFESDENLPSLYRMLDISIEKKMLTDVTNLKKEHKYIKSTLEQILTILEKLTSQ